MLDFLLHTVLQQENAQSYALESKSVTAGMELKSNQIFVVERIQGAVYAYQSADESTDQSEGFRVTVNRKFIEITAGSPILIGWLITITERKKRLDITLITDNNNNLENIKVE